jgi:hypothetical protein
MHTSRAAVVNAVNRAFARDARLAIAASMLQREVSRIEADRRTEARGASVR